MDEALKGLVVLHYDEPLKKLGVPQNYPFLSSGYCEELCNYIRSLKTSDHKNFTELTEDELRKIGEDLNQERNRRIQILLDAQQKRYKAELARKNKSRIEFRPKLLKWVKESLKPGMRVWMSGCKDGKGYRLVLSNPNPDSRIDPKWNPEIDSYSIECRQILLHTRFLNNEKPYRKEVTETMGQITNHLYHKITAVEIDGKKISIRELLKTI